MLRIFKLTVTFVDTDTGEIIRKYQYQQGQDDEKEPIDLYQFLTDKLLVSFIQSFRRGCRQKRNLSLHLDFNTENVF